MPSYDMVGDQTEITKTVFRLSGSGDSGIHPASYQITSQLTNRLSQHNSLILSDKLRHICNFSSITRGAIIARFSTYYNFLYDVLRFVLFCGELAISKLSKLRWLQRSKNMCICIYGLKLPFTKHVCLSPNHQNDHHKHRKKSQGQTNCAKFDHRISFNSGRRRINIESQQSRKIGRCNSWK